MEKSSHSTFTLEVKYHMRHILISAFFVLLLSACDPMSLMPGAQEKFVDQGFKTAISLIELYHIRMGEYPKKMNEIKYTGDWDLIYQQFVKYRKLDNGYQLDVKDNKISQKLSYPKEFWSGLGLVATNVQGFIDQPIEKNKFNSI